MSVMMAQWGDTSYRPGGHALRIATEMGLWRCLPYLVQTGMGAGKTAAEVAEERPLVVGARVWMTIFKTECQCVDTELNKGLADFQDGF